MSHFIVIHFVNNYSNVEITTVILRRWRTRLITHCIANALVIVPCRISLTVCFERSVVKTCFKGHMVMVIGHSDVELFAIFKNSAPTICKTHWHVLRTRAGKCHDDHKANVQSFSCSCFHYGVQWCIGVKGLFRMPSNYPHDNWKLLE